MKLSLGKIPIELLNQIVFKNLGIDRKEVAVGPKAGIDGAVIDLGERSIIVSMDPVTGAIKNIGWLAVNVNANDIATFGVEPAFMFSCILLPENADSNLVEEISSQIHNAAKELGIAIVGGHCEPTIGLVNPVVVGCIIGFTDKKEYLTADGAKPGDNIILTKSAGIEGTAILATEKEKILRKVIGSQMVQDAKNFYKEISIVKDAITAYKTGGVHAMHDPTEGGIIGGIHEIADASKLGVKIFKNKIPIRSETSAICKYFKIDPLHLISSGALLLSVSPNNTNKIIEELYKNRIQAKVIGEFLTNINQRIMMLKNGQTKVLSRPESDHIWKALKS
jgi:hydrogenase maturation factor